MEEVATPAQKERWLRPLVAGRIRSCFAMTEPAPGAGADPSMLRPPRCATATTTSSTAPSGSSPAPKGAASPSSWRAWRTARPRMFLADMDAPGIASCARWTRWTRCFTGGHGVLSFENLRVPATDVLGEIGKGFRYAQVRLAPARLTHCMRWLGQARRAHDVAVDYARAARGLRQAAGGARRRRLHARRQRHGPADRAPAHLAHRLAARPGAERCNFESSRAKVVCSEAEWRVVDRCVQILGGQGVTDETVVMRIFTDMRAFRIYDGPSEVHRWSMARNDPSRRRRTRWSVNHEPVWSDSGSTAGSVLVTGASSGLGRHFARLLAQAGARVVVAARRIDKLEALVAEIAAAGGDARAVALDVTDAAERRRAASTRIEPVGACPTSSSTTPGVTVTKPLLQQTEADWDSGARHQPEGRLAGRHRGGAPHGGRGAGGQHRQRRLDPGRAGGRRRGAVCDLQGRGDPGHQGDGAGTRPPRHPRQCAARPAT